MTKENMEASANMILAHCEDGGYIYIKRGKGLLFLFFFSFFFFSILPWGVSEMLKKT